MPVSIDLLLGQKSIGQMFPLALPCMVPEITGKDNSLRVPMLYAPISALVHRNKIHNSLTLASRRKEAGEKPVCLRAIVHFWIAVVPEVLLKVTSLGPGTSNGFQFLESVFVVVVAVQKLPQIIFSGFQPSWTPWNKRLICEH